mgnify:CR=1 FL=1
MTKSANRTDLTAEEQDIVDHAKSCGIHVKKAGRHSGHTWYCFDCQGLTTDHISGREQVHPTDHTSFDSNQAIMAHLKTTHDVHWSSAYYVEEDGA